MKRIQGARLYTSAFIFQDLDLLIEGKKIKAIIPRDIVLDEGEVEHIDARGKYLIPGMIDVHIHGAVNYDTMEANHAGMEAVSLFLAQHGVTAFCPTTMTQTVEAISTALSQNINFSYAKALGFNLEGPFLAASKRGAHLEKHLRKPSIEEFSNYMKLANIKIVTLAPELEGSLEFIERFGPSCVISLGHTATDHDTAMKAYGHGAKSITHCFNAMPSLLHRQPGLIGAAAHHHCFAEIICDGIHIHPAAIYSAYRMFGSDRLVLISDAMRATGLADGPYDLGGQTVNVCEGKAISPDGVLAGSTTNLHTCLKNVVEFGISLEDAVRMATYNPASLVSETDKRGSLEAGLVADLVLLNQDLSIDSVYLEGKLLEPQTA